MNELIFMRNRINTPRYRACRLNRQAAFTLIEVLLALSLFLVLLAVVFVPLNQAFLSFNAGRTSIALQGAADATVKSIATELQGAVKVYPNAQLPGVIEQKPYYEGACVAVNNLSRIDFVLPSRSNGVLDTPIKQKPYIVTYYVRRLDNSIDYADFTNPMGVFRAQIPYQSAGGTELLYADSRRYITPPACTDGKKKWLTQLQADVTHPAEPDITSLVATPSDGGAVTLVSPRDMMVPSTAAAGDPLLPDVSFQCEDTDNNGVIDRVTINLTLIQFEQGNSGRNGAPSGQRITATRTINLSNTRFPSF